MGKIIDVYNDVHLMLKWFFRGGGSVGGWHLTLLFSFFLYESHNLVFLKSKPQPSSYDAQVSSLEY